MHLLSQCRRIHKHCYFNYYALYVYINALWLALVKVKGFRYSQHTLHAPKRWQERPTHLHVLEPNIAWHLNSWITKIQACYLLLKSDYCLKIVSKYIMIVLICFFRIRFLYITELSKSPLRLHSIIVSSKNSLSYCTLAISNTC